MVVSAMDKNEPGPCHHKGYILTYLKGLVWTQHLTYGSFIRFSFIRKQQKLNSYQTEQIRRNANIGLAPATAGFRDSNMIRSQSLSVFPTVLYTILALFQIHCHQFGTMIDAMSPTDILLL